MCTGALCVFIEITTARPQGVAQAEAPKEHMAGYGAAQILGRYLQCIVSLQVETGARELQRFCEFVFRQLSDLNTCYCANYIIQIWMPHCELLIGKLRPVKQESVLNRQCWIIPYNLNDCVICSKFCVKCLGFLFQINIILTAIYECTKVWYYHYCSYFCNNIQNSRSSLEVTVVLSTIK